VKIGIFGGSFDPPHLSHRSVCSDTLALTDVDEVVVIPCYEHAFGKVTTPFEHRLRMCELAFGDLSRVGVSDVERQLGGRSYTVRTLEHLRRVLTEVDLSLIIGADAFRDRNGWRDFDRITELAELIVFGRGEIELLRPSLPAPRPISSTEVREKLRSGTSVEGLVSAAVLGYIERNGLYRE